MPEQANVQVDLVVNGTPKSIQVHPMARLIDVLREDMRLTGTKEGCGEGECGACSVFVDGTLVNSCLIPIVQLRGCRVETIEGLAADAKLEPLPAAFIDKGGAQCGICTPGMLMAAASLIRRKTDADEPEIREAIAGNLCRCTGYTRIVDSVLEACRVIREEQGA